MANPQEWAKGYARQAQADFQSWQAMEGHEVVQPCHRMLFLQMVCEKLCKAWLINSGTSPDILQTSHGYIANPLPVVLRAQLEFAGERLSKHQGLIKFTRLLANEIEVSNPAVDRNGQRPDNTEYPWENGNNILHSPLDWSFTPLQLLQERFGRTFLKLLHQSIERILNELN